MAGKNKRSSSGRGYGSSSTPSSSFLAARAYDDQPSAAGIGVVEDPFLAPNINDTSATEQALLMQLVGMDSAYQGLFRTLFGCLDEQAKKRLAMNSDFRAWVGSLEFFRNNDTLPGLQFNRIQRPSCVSDLALAI